MSSTDLTDTAPHGQTDAPPTAAAPVSVMIDADRITQAWLQLAANAVRHSTPGAIITLTSRVSATRPAAFTHAVPSGAGSGSTFTIVVPAGAASVASRSAVPPPEVPPEPTQPHRQNDFASTRTSGSSP